MCGIFGYTGKQTIGQDIVLAGLKSLEYRGYDSWGIAALNSNSHHFVLKKRTGKIGQATTKGLPQTSFSLGHTRWATHGGVTQANAHPHTDCTGQIALIHNGIIENYQEIKQELLKKGHTFKSETDSEVAAHLIEDLLKKYDLPEAVRRAFKRFEGLSAIIVMHQSHPEFVAARNGSPLVIGFGSGENYLASDAAALLPYTHTVYFMQDYDLAIVGPRKVTVKSVKTGELRHIKAQRLTWSTDAAQKGKYRHFMLKEIMEQPDILRQIATTDDHQLKKLSRMIKTAFGTYLVGCGTASYACLAGEYLFSRLANQHVNAAIGSEFGYHLDFIGKDSLIMALSQSGETMDTLESIKKAKAKGASIMALVNVLGSTLYREADAKILLGAGPEKAVASTKAFTAKMAYLILLATAISKHPDKGKQLLKAAISSSRQILQPKSLKWLRSLARKFKSADHIFVVGRGLSYPASLETALKIKEISYIHAEGFAAGELKHGVIALIEQGTPCIVFAPNDETYGANLSGAMELKARGGHIIGISHQDHEIFDDFIKVKDAQEATIIPNVIVAQLFAYYLALARGLDPDMPRNLAKSVTVK